MTANRLQLSWGELREREPLLSLSPPTILHAKEGSIDASSQCLILSLVSGPPFCCGSISAEELLLERLNKGHTMGLKGQPCLQVVGELWLVFTKCTPKCLRVWSRLPCTVEWSETRSNVLSSTSECVGWWGAVDDLVSAGLGERVRWQESWWGRNQILSGSNALLSHERSWQRGHDRQSLVFVFLAWGW